MAEVRITRNSDEAAKKRVVVEANLRKIRNCPSCGNDGNKYREGSAFKSTIVVVESSESKGFPKPKNYVTKYCHCTYCGTKWELTDLRENFSM